MPTDPRVRRQATAAAQTPPRGEVSGVSGRKAFDKRTYGLTAATEDSILNRISVASTAALKEIAEEISCIMFEDAAAVLLVQPVGTIVSTAACAAMGSRRPGKPRKSSGPPSKGGCTFPANPDLLTTILGVVPVESTTPDGTRRLKWQPNDHTRIRFESHPHGLGPGDAGYNPRHHGEHYHVETKPDGQSWSKANRQGTISKCKPAGYKPGGGTGFLPGEVFL